jgi:hypothetical protein
MIQSSIVTYTHPHVNQEKRKTEKDEQEQFSTVQPPPATNK